MLFDNRGPGLRVFDVPGPVLWNNLIYQNGSSGAVISGDADGSPAAQVLNNTFFQNANRGLLLGGSDLEPPSETATVLRNIFAGNAVAGLQVNRLSLPGYTGDYNLSADAYGPGTPVGEHDVSPRLCSSIPTVPMTFSAAPLRQTTTSGCNNWPPAKARRARQWMRAVSKRSPPVWRIGRRERTTSRTRAIADLGYHYRIASLRHCDSALAARSCEPTNGADCDGDGRVAINELILGVNISLGLLSLDECPGFDQDGDGTVNIGELIAAVALMLATV